MKTLVLTTARLRLRGVRAADEAVFCALYGDASTMRHIARPWSHSVAARRFQALLETTPDCNGAHFFAIALKDRAAAIGFCGIQAPEPRTRAAEVGIVLGADARGRGYGGEALRAAIAFAFDSLPIDRVWVQYRSSNSAARRLFAGAGFESAAVRSQSVRRQRQVRVLQRADSCEHSSPTRRGSHRVERHQFS